MFPPPVFSLSPRLCLSTPPSLFGSFPLSLSLSPSLALARFFVSPLWSESRFLWYRCIWVFVCFTGEYYRRGRVHLLQAYLTIFKFYFLTCTSASFGLNASYGLNALCQPLKGFQVSYTTIAPCCTCCNLGPECAVKTASITAMAAATPLTLWLSLLLKARDLRSQDVTTWILYEYCMNIVCHWNPCAPSLLPQPRECPPWPQRLSGYGVVDSRNCCFIGVSVEGKSHKHPAALAVGLPLLNREPRVPHHGCQHHWDAPAATITEDDDCLITITSGLVPLIQGSMRPNLLVIWDYQWFCVHIFCCSFSEEKIC